ncbi:hypothetical protein [Mesorhizobium sp.]|uniref:hypothetical protein n=1 Tax=Mesorhizobium sp. TaxID=1871066 RepID=UPI00257B4FD1|nr:hypothetical protein [Mesorhizobium sp.]
MSLNQWIASAVAQKVGAMKTAADFLRRRAGNASVGVKPPQPGDELPFEKR